MHGFTENYVRVSAKYDPLLIHELKKVQLVSISEKGPVIVEDVESLVLTIR